MDIDASEFLDGVAQARVAALAARPLTMGLLLDVYADDGSLPEKLTEPKSVATKLASFGLHLGFREWRAWRRRGRSSRAAESTVQRSIIPRASVIWIAIAARHPHGRGHIPEVDAVR